MCSPRLLEDDSCSEEKTMTDHQDQDDIEPADDEAPDNAASAGGSAHDATIKVEENE